MLIKSKDLFPILRCPVTGQKLFKKENEYEFKYYTKNREYMYDICNGIPLLIDDKSSIVSLQDLKSFKPLVSRKIYKGFFSFAKKLTSPSKTRTKENVNLLISELSNIKEIPKVLIIGGGTVGQGMDYFYTSSNIDLVSFDIYNSPNINFIADAHQIPLPKNYFDAVIIQAVLEHVLEPCEVVKEIYRVLKPRGIVYAETPFLQQVHEGGYDFTRFTESGHRYLFREFKLIKSGSTAGTGTQMLWSIDYFFRGLFRSRLIGKIAKVSFFWIRYFDYLIPEKFNIDCASGVFFLGSKSNEKLHVKEIPSCYRGSQ